MSFLMYSTYCLSPKGSPDLRGVEVWTPTLNGGMTCTYGRGEMDEPY